MTLLVFVLVVLVVLALAIYAAQMLPAMDDRVRQLIIVVLILIAVLVIAQRAGLF